MKKTYDAVKKQYPDHILLMKHGNQFAAFGDDAESLSKYYGESVLPTGAYIVSSGQLPYVIEAMIRRNLRVAIITPDGTKEFPVAHDPTAPVTHLTYIGNNADATLCGAAKTDDALYEHAIYHRAYAIPNLCPACQARWEA